MSGRIVICGDVHFKKQFDSPYNQGLRKLIPYIVEKYADDHLMFTGDFFDEIFVHKDVETEAVGMLLKHEHVTIVTGNHELSGTFGNALAPLKNTKIEIVDKPVREKDYATGLTVQYLPFLPKVPDLKQYSLIKETCDVSISHVAFPGTNWGAADEIPFNFKAEIVHGMGHIHVGQSFQNEYGNFEIIGIPQVTRHLEQFQTPRVLIIDSGGYRFEELPVFFTIETVKFGDEPRSTENLINIVDAPSYDIAFDRYGSGDYFLRDIETARTEIQEDVRESLDKSLNRQETVLQKLHEWCKATGKSQEVRDRISSYLVQKND